MNNNSKKNVKSGYFYFFVCFSKIHHVQGYYNYPSKGGKYGTLYSK